MEKDSLTYHDYAVFAALPLEELARQCDAQVFHATGPGGQGVNTADSAVRMTHVPTGLTVTSRESRSQYRNRQLCLQKLRAAFAERARPPKMRHATRPSRASRERRLAEKRHRSELKGLRGRVTGES